MRPLGSIFFYQLLSSLLLLLLLLLLIACRIKLTVKQIVSALTLNEVNLIIIVECLCMCLRPIDIYSILEFIIGIVFSFIISFFSFLCHQHSSLSFITSGSCSRSYSFFHLFQFQSLIPQNESYHLVFIYVCISIRICHFLSLPLSFMYINTFVVCVCVCV